MKSVCWEMPEGFRKDCTHQSTARCTFPLTCRCHNYAGSIPLASFCPYRITIVDCLYLPCLQQILLHIRQLHRTKELYPSLYSYRQVLIHLSQWPNKFLFQLYQALILLVYMFESASPIFVNLYRITSTGCLCYPRHNLSAVLLSERYYLSEKLALLGITEGNVKVRVFRAREQLAKLIGEDDVYMSWTRYALGVFGWGASSKIRLGLREPFNKLSTVSGWFPKAPSLKH